VATDKQGDIEKENGHLAINTAPIVSQQEWEIARQQLLMKETAFNRPVTRWPQQCTYTRTSSGSPTWQPVWPGGRPIAQ
jgi:hypothetical protein